MKAFRQQFKVRPSLGLIGACIGLLLMMAAPARAQQAKQSGATVSILHGLPEFTYDFYVNGTLTLNGFKPFLATEPLHLPSGVYDFAIRDVGSPADSSPDAQLRVTLENGKNYSVIAHLNNNGAEGLALFENDLSRVPVGKSRLVVRSVAQAPAVDIRLNGKTQFSNVTDHLQPAANLAPGTYSVEAISTDDHSLLVDGTRFSAQEGTESFLYLVGAVDDGTLDFMVQTLTDVGAQPTDILSGNGGLAAPAAFPTWAILLLMLAGCGVIGSILTLRHQRIPSGRTEAKA